VRPSPTARLSLWPLTPSACRRVLRLQPQHNCCTLGDLANRVGWKHQKAVAILETKRKLRSKAFYVAKKAMLNKRAQIEAAL